MLKKCIMEIKKKNDQRNSENIPGRFQDPVLPETVNLSGHPSIICANFLQQYLVAQEGEWRKQAMKQGDFLVLPVDTGERKVSRVERNGKKTLLKTDLWWVSSQKTQLSQRSREEQIYHLQQVSTASQNSRTGEFLS